MSTRWGDSQADRDALDRWLTTEPDRGDEAEEGMEAEVERDTPIGTDDDGGFEEPGDIDDDTHFDPYGGCWSDDC